MELGTAQGTEYGPAYRVRKHPHTHSTTPILPHPFYHTHSTTPILPHYRTHAIVLVPPTLFPYPPYRTTRANTIISFSHLFILHSSPIHPLVYRI
ncbi:hypothetical protein B484DRAFT_452828 [Ochromonadaceae sp. CCMP2298]|nr:hypothetical protein B484DRAFT_452828 [Ochromonadaceae sp. CCMP2298]